ncbi:MAG: hypothetical protein ACTSUX_07415, partial [Promethearchaeota archaeon]
MQNNFFKPLVLIDSIDEKNRLILNCKGCNSKRNFKKCLSCILNSLNEKNHVEISEISLNSSLSLKIEEMKVISLLNVLYFSFKRKFTTINCSNGQESCQNEDINNFFLNKFDEKGFIDMLEYFFCQPIKEVSSSDLSSPCYLCLNRINKKLKFFQRIYKKSHFYRYILSKYGILRVSMNFFLNLFPTLKENRNISPSKLDINEFNKIEEY